MPSKQTITLSSDCNYLAIVPTESKCSSALRPQPDQAHSLLCGTYLLTYFIHNHANRFSFPKFVTQQYSLAGLIVSKNRVLTFLRKLAYDTQKSPNNLIVFSEMFLFLS